MLVAGTWGHTLAQQACPPMRPHTCTGWKSRRSLKLSTAPCPCVCREPVIAQARQLWPQRHPALTDRIQLVAGDFFDRCPPADM